jgi:hypothetical protein
VDFVCEHKRSALFMGLGLGKTITTLTAIARQVFTGSAKRVLVIAPLRVANTVWAAEAARWSHTRALRVSIATGSAEQRLRALRAPADVYVINVENTQWLVSRFKRSGWKWDWVVVDESSGFKSPSAKRGVALRTAAVDTFARNRRVRRSQVTRMTLLSATPATNGLTGLWAQFALIDGGKRLGRSFSAFENQYFYAPPNASRYAKVIPHDGAKVAIYEKLNDVVHMLDTCDHLDMPPLIFNDIMVRMPAKAMSQYRELEKEFLLELPEIDAEVLAVNSAALANKLLQIAQGTPYLGETPEERVAHREYAILHDAKLDALKELVANAEGNENLLVAYWFRSDRERLMHAFPQAVLMDREGSAVDAWNAGRIPLLLVHPMSAGHGLNLQHGGCTCIFYSMLWSLEAYQQLIGRLYRQGQTHAVTVNHIMCHGTIEKRVSQILRSNAETQQQFIDALKEQPTLLPMA